MKTATKAALLSGLVFPGLGHLYLKCYRRAILLLIASAVALAIVVNQAVQTARIIADKILSGEIAPDPAVIAAQVEAASAAADSTAVTIAYATLFICWLIGIADAYRLAERRAIEREAR